MEKNICSAGLLVYNLKPLGVLKRGPPLASKGRCLHPVVAYCTVYPWGLLDCSPATWGTPSNRLSPDVRDFRCIWKIHMQAAQANFTVKFTYTWARIRKGVIRTTSTVPNVSPPAPFGLLLGASSFLSC